MKSSVIIWLAHHGHIGLFQALAAFWRQLVSHTQNDNSLKWRVASQRKPCKQCLLTLGSNRSWQLGLLFYKHVQISDKKWMDCYVQQWSGWYVCIVWDSLLRQVVVFDEVLCSNEWITCYESLAVCHLVPITSFILFCLRLKPSFPLLFRSLGPTMFCVHGSMSASEAQQNLGDSPGQKLNGTPSAMLTTLTKLATSATNPVFLSVSIRRHIVPSNGSAASVSPVVSCVCVPSAAARPQPWSTHT